MKPDRRAKDLVPHLTRELVAYFAAHALGNAKELQDSARILFEHGRYGAARSLAVCAREECGKVFIAGRYLIGGNRSVI